MKNKYSEVYMRITYELATLIFLKKDGTTRVMLGTRNLDTIRLMHNVTTNVFNGRDKRAHINNGNIALFDMLVGDIRVFNIDRLVSIYYHGDILKREELEKAMKEHLAFQSNYENAIRSKESVGEDYGY